LCARATELGYRVRRIVLATRHTLPADLEATERLVVPGSELVVSENLDDLTRAIGECTVLASMKFHGLVVATMYGIPTLSLMGTNKNRNFLRRIDRLDLKTSYADPELPDRLEGGLAPIDPGTVLELRTEATAMLTDLRSRLLEV
jgi:polysaccharide pyruvyl transferase WcaK-like protein